MLYVVFVLQCECLTYCFTYTLYLCTAKSLLWSIKALLMNETIVLISHIEIKCSAQEKSLMNMHLHMWCII